MVCVLARLAIGLQTVAKPVQEFADERAPDLVPHIAQALAEVAQALAGPEQWRLRIAARIGLDERAQILDEVGVCCGQPLEPVAWTPHSIGVAGAPNARLVQSAPDRAARKTRDPLTPRLHRPAPPLAPLPPQNVATRARPTQERAPRSASEWPIRQSRQKAIGSRVPKESPPRSAEPPPIHLFSDAP